MFPVTIFWEVLFFSAGIWLIERGKLSRFISIILNINLLTLILLPQVYILDDGTTASLALPPAIVTPVSFFFIMMVFLSIASFQHLRGRDVINRKNRVFALVPVPQRSG